MTDALYAPQLVYTRVEQEFSPTRSSGFQTIYRSPELTSAQIDQVERRVQCFQPSDPQTLRLQFFQLDDGAVVLSQSRLITPWPEFQRVVDRQRPSGVFVAHCLVMSPEVFWKAGGDPLALLQTPLFTPDLPALLERYGNPASSMRTHGRPNGLVPALQLDAPLAAHASVGNWNPEEVRRLLALALQSQTLTRAGKSVALIGAQHDILTALRIALGLVPIEHRLTCSFDTCVERCGVPPGRYWAVGVNERPGGATYIDVHTAQQRVLSSVTLVEPPNDLYALWIVQMTRQRDVAQALQYAPTVQRIAQAMKERIPLPADVWQDEAGCQAFLSVHGERVRASITQALHAALGSERLAVLIIDAVFSSLDSPAQLLDAACRQSLEQVSLSTLAYEALVLNKPVLSKGDWKQLSQLHQREPHEGLLFLIATAHKPDTKQVARALAQMPMVMYRDLLMSYGTSLPPALFVGGEHVDELIDYLLTNRQSLSAAETYHLYVAILCSKHVALLNRLTLYVPYLGPQECRRIRKLFQQHMPPTEFRRAIDDAIAAQPQRGFFARLFRRHM
ncbi:MAG: hypothetical protein OHK0022_30050 [Roseiflexaceae bacterium]